MDKLVNDKLKPISKEKLMESINKAAEKFDKESAARRVTSTEQLKVKVNV